MSLALCKACNKAPCECGCSRCGGALLAKDTIHDEVCQTESCGLPVRSHLGCYNLRTLKKTTAFCSAHHPGRLKAQALTEQHGSSVAVTSTSAPRTAPPVELAQVLVCMKAASATYDPEVRVTYTRLDRLHDAWNAFAQPSCKGSQLCACRRCVTMDILTMTHIVERSDIAAGLVAVEAYIKRICLGAPWGLVSLMPGKSNFWLSGLLCQRLEPACVFLTKVDDIVQMRPQPWHAYCAVKPELLKHVFVLDDMSYSGTQLANLLRAVGTKLPAATVHACPLFVTPHALPVISRAGATLWDGVSTTLANSALFATLGNHRESAATSFEKLMQMYGSACGETRHIEYQKTLTTTIPYYKVPDYFSCPDKAYISPPGVGSTEIKQLRFTCDADQQPAYKNAVSVSQKLGLN